MENSVPCLKRDVLAFEHLPNSRIVGRADHAVGDLDRKMEVAEQPAGARPAFRIVRRQRDFQHRLRPLANRIARVCLHVKNGAIPKRLREIEPKLRAILRHAAPAPLRQREPIYDEQHPRRIGRSGRTVDDLHRAKMRTISTRGNGRLRYFPSEPPDVIRHLYFHVPFCPKLCPYCCFYVETGGKNKTRRFIEALLREMEMQAAAHALQPATIYLGGGTPSALGISQLAQLLEGMHGVLDLRALAEWTIEINPATVSREKARLLREHGITRVSMGVQSWDDAVLRTLGRVHDSAQAARTFETLRAAGFDNINLDLMFAVPGQTREQWRATLERTIALRPEHVSAYCLTYEEDTAFFEKLRAGEFQQDENWDADLFEMTMDALGGAGFAHYEISNHAQPGHESAHNLAYWRGADYLGFGPSAFSTVGGRRWQNAPDSARYVEAIFRGETAVTFTEELDPDLKRREALAFGLRTSRGVPMAALAAWEPAVAEFRELGFIESAGDRVVLTRRGKMMADSVAEAFV